MADWMRPVYKLQETFLEFTRMMSACQMTQFAKQLETRVSTWSGVMDMAAAVGGSIAKYFAYTSGGVYTDPTMYTDATQALWRSALVDAALDLFNSKTCARQARALGTVLAEVLNVQSPDAVYFKDLTFQLTNTNQ